MDDDKVVEKILQSLVELEQRGELVLTTNFGLNVARHILHSALEQLITDMGETEEPIECTMPHLLEQTVQEVRNRFDVPNQRAREITGFYYDQLLERLTVGKIAELYWHDTPSEMAQVHVGWSPDSTRWNG